MPKVRMEKSKKKKKTSPMEGQAPWSQSRRQLGSLPPALVLAPFRGPWSASSLTVKAEAAPCGPAPVGEKTEASNSPRRLCGVPRLTLTLACPWGDGVCELAEAGRGGC